jgi:AcrR family transcriptional regulator
VSPRPYDSRRRTAAAQETREKILDAARAVIAGKGDLSEFSIDAVAQKAGVARMTVYNQFRSRAGLLEALADHLAGRGGMSRMRSIFTEPEFDRALTALVETFVAFWASDRVTLRRLRAMAVAFPDSDGVARNRDAWRREAITNLLAKFRLRRGSPTVAEGPDLVDVLTALTSFETFDALCTPKRSPAQVATLLSGLAVSLAQRSSQKVANGRARGGVD